MQKEHVIYALTGLAVECQLGGLNDFAELLIEMSLNENVPTRLAQLMDESDEDDLVQALIEKRITGR